MGQLISILFFFFFFFFGGGAGKKKVTFGITFWNSDIRSSIQVHALFNRHGITSP